MEIVLGEQRQTDGQTDRRTDGHAPAVRFFSAISVWQSFSAGVECVVSSGVVLNYPKKRF